MIDQSTSRLHPWIKPVFAGSVLFLVMMSLVTLMLMSVDVPPPNPTTGSITPVRGHTPTLNSVASRTGTVTPSLVVARGGGIPRATVTMALSAVHQRIGTRGHLPVADSIAFLAAKANVGFQPIPIIMASCGRADHARPAEERHDLDSLLVSGSVAIATLPPLAAPLRADVNVRLPLFQPATILRV